MRVYRTGRLGLSRGRPHPALSAKPIDKTVRNGKPSEEVNREMIKDQLGHSVEKRLSTGNQRAAR